MKKPALVFILLILTYTACSTASAQGGDLSLTEEKLLRQACLDVPDGKDCSIPAPYSDEFRGVCCQGSCRAYSSDCSSRGVGGPSLLDVMLTAPCENAKNGDKCDISGETAKRYNLYGTCCSEKCRYWAESCSTVSDDNTGPPTAEQMEKLATLFCTGVEDGSACKIEQEAREKLGLFGVCCGGTCAWREEKCPLRPDLVLKDIKFLPEDMSKALKLERVDVMIVNEGDAPTGSYFWVQLDKGDGSSTLNQEVRTYLKAGERTIVSFTDIPAYRTTGRYVLSAAADASPNSVRNDLIAEKSEDNNRGTWEIYVGELIDRNTTSADAAKEMTAAASALPSADTPLVGGKTANTIQNSGGLQWLLLAAVAVVCLIAAIAVVYMVTRKKGGPVFDEELQIQSLLKEKKTIEEMIELAKAKYHKRTLDEESFKEIVKENQKKLIEVETRIGDLEARTKKLEEK